MRRLTLALVIGALMLGASLWQDHHGAIAQSTHAGRHRPSGRRLPLQQGGRGRVSRRGHGRAGRDRQRRGHRQRRRRGDRRRPRLARRRLGAARRSEAPHAQAGALRDQHALPLRPRARQPDLRRRRGHHRPRVHARRCSPAASRCRCRSTRATSTAMPAPDRDTPRPAWQPRRIPRRAPSCRRSSPSTENNLASQKELRTGAAERHAAHAR